MSRLDEAIDEMTYITDCLRSLRDIIYSMPTISPKAGRWIDCKGSDGKDYRKCSECLHTQEITGLLNFCPVCGARMVGEEDE